MPTKTILILGTGGTIAGSAGSRSDHVGYKAGQIGVEQLLQALPELADWPLRHEQLAQLDSKDMTPRPGADSPCASNRPWRMTTSKAWSSPTAPTTLEESAYLLHRLLHTPKPVVMTAAMRPASSCSPDGPQNLLEAMLLARSSEVHGVLVAMQGAVHRADRVRKLHSYRIDAFGSPDGGPVALIENGVLRQLQPWPEGGRPGCQTAESRTLAKVEILVSSAAGDGALVPLLQQLALQEGRRLGLVAAGTGNGTLNRDLEAALEHCERHGDGGPAHCTRCAAGPVIGGHLASAGSLSAAQARVELLLRLLADAG
jgi:L-asparaginase